MAPAAGRVRAGNGTRTRDPNLGKVVLYQLSYSRELLDAEAPRVDCDAFAVQCNRSGPSQTRRLGVSASRRLAVMEARGIEPLTS